MCGAISKDRSEWGLSAHCDGRMRLCPPVFAEQESVVQAMLLFVQAPCYLQQRIETPDVCKARRVGKWCLIPARQDSKADCSCCLWLSIDQVAQAYASRAPIVVG